MTHARITLLLACATTLAACTDENPTAEDAALPTAPDAALPGAPDAAAPGQPDAALPGAPDAAPPSGVSFTRHTVDSAAGGPAYVSVADLDDDGTLDLVVSAFGQMAGFAVPVGEVSLYRRGADLSTWTRTPIVPSSEQVIFPNQTTVDDLDGDGDLDVLVPSGFLICSITFIPNNAPCGALAWYEQTAGGWVEHTLTSGQALFYHHAVLVDMDGDATRDLVTVGEEQAFLGAGMTRAEAVWFKGTASGDRFETSKHVIGAGLGSFPRVLDVDDDGDLDVAGAEFFVTGGSFAWYERDGASYTRHVIDSTSGPSIQLSFIDDLYGDGVRRAVGANHVNTAKSPPDPQESAVFVFDVPADPEQAWTPQPISQGIVSLPGSQMSPQGAPGIFGHGDVDGDGDLDLVVSGDGDPNVYWLEQTGAGAWVTHVLDTGLEQAGGMVIADLDGDGAAEIVVTGYTDNVVYVYQRD